MTLSGTIGSETQWQPTLGGSEKSVRACKPAAESTIAMRIAIVYLSQRWNVASRVRASAIAAAVWAVGLSGLPATLTVAETSSSGKSVARRSRPEIAGPQSITIGNTTPP